MTSPLHLPDGYRFEDDPSSWDREAMHAYLDTTYWSAGVDRSRRERGFDNSLGVAMFYGKEQVGYARVVTDYSRFAYLADVYVEAAHQRRGLARAMVEWLHRHPDLEGVGRWLLITRDAAGLYTGLGYGPPDDIGQFMQRRVTR